MQPLRIERVAAHVEETVKTNGHSNGNGNGHTNGNGNGNGKGRKKATVVTSDDVLPEIVEVAGK